jgi:hypothetical protein
MREYSWEEQDLLIEEEPKEEELSSLNVTKEFNEVKKNYFEFKGMGKQKVETLKIDTSKRVMNKGMIKRGMILTPSKT